VRRIFRGLLIALLVLVLLVTALVGVAVYGMKTYSAPGPLPTTRAIYVPHGTPAALAQSLVEAGVIDSPLAFRIAAFLSGSGGPLRSGEYVFPEHANLLATLTILRSAKPVQHKLTIPEGLTAAQIAQLLDRAAAMEGDTPVPAEGEMLPETYSYTYGTQRGAMVERARAAMDKALSQVWAARAANLPLATPQELLTLASIVERETSRPEERAHVAAVFLNRLRHGMKLQSDPTVAYAASGGMTTNDRGLTRADLEAPNPYNTYVIPGLPPGPIVSPGLAALQAVAKPLATDDLYFVADGEGGHVFARTLDEHNHNVVHWRALNTKP